MYHWNKNINQFKELSNGNSALEEELLWLENSYNNIFCSDTKWNTLSDQEKQLQRIFRSKSAKKTDGYKLGVFAYEESVIDLYMAVELVLNQLEKTDVKHLQIIRLKACLYLEKKNINAFRDAINIKDFYYQQIKSVIYFCLNCEFENFFTRETDILYLESKLDIVNQYWVKL